MFIEKGADVKTKDANGWATVHVLCRNNTHDNLLDLDRLLIEKGVNVKAKKTNGWTVLDLVTHILLTYKKGSNLIHLLGVISNGNWGIF